MRRSQPQKRPGYYAALRGGLSRTSTRSGKKRARKFRRRRSKSVALCLVLCLVFTMLLYAKKTPTKEKKANFAPSEGNEIAEMIQKLDLFVRALHRTFLQLRSATPREVWRGYVDVVEEYILDQVETIEIPEVREDNRIFVSLASYRDASLNDTLTSLFMRADQPERIVVAVIQQICIANCKTGVQVISKEGEPVRTKISDTGPDEDGIQQFCGSRLHKYCSKHLRVLYLNETEALGPVFARYLASKLWLGEQYYMQIDAHVDMADHWDTKLIQELTSLPGKPVISAYPPQLSPHDRSWQNRASAKLCSAEFSKSPVEHKIIRVNALPPSPKNIQAQQRRIPFVAAGFFAVNAHFLHLMPFDPFGPWLFMGEEIALSARFFTNGFDAYAPSKNLLTHAYRPGRLGLPKFWETTARVFANRGGFNSQLTALIINRLKFIVGYPASEHDDAAKQQAENDVLVHLHHPRNYALGHLRSLDDFLSLAKIDFSSFSAGTPSWCRSGTPPP